MSEWVKSRAVPGDRAAVWLGPPKKGRWYLGEVAAVDPPGYATKGVLIVLDGAQGEMYATHDETRVLR